MFRVSAKGLGLIGTLKRFRSLHKSRGDPSLGSQHAMTLTIGAPSLKIRVPGVPSGFPWDRLEQLENTFGIAVGLRITLSPKR